VTEASTRIEGEIVSWDDEKGFGFAAAPSVGGDIFVHAKFLRARHVRPAIGDRVTFVLAEGRNGRAAATDIQIVGAPPAQPPRAPASRASKERLSALDVSRLAAAVALLLVVAAAVVAGRAPAWVAGLYAGMGIVSGLLYWVDKRYAVEGRLRVREMSLHLSDILFGIAGGLFAQHVFRHKTRKLSFRYITRLIFLTHALLLTAVLSGMIRFP